MYSAFFFLFLSKTEVPGVFGGLPRRAKKVLAWATVHFQAGTVA
jgi:hypothetical protein